MWPWRRKLPPQAPPDPLLGEVQAGVLAAISSLRQHCHELAHALNLQAESVSDARKLETRLHKVENMATHTRHLLEGEIARIDQSVNQLRGTQTGALRARRDRTAEDIGVGLVNVLGGTERAQQLVFELQQRAVQNGEVDPRGGTSSNDAAIGG
jgi:hypothetical protein